MNIVRSFGLVSVRFALSFFLLHSVVRAGDPPLKPTTAPPLRECKVSATSNLGRWDDAFAPYNQDFVLLRRGDEFYSLAMVPSSTPRKASKTPAAEHTQIIAGAVAGKRCWVFLNSTKVVPCAIDVHSGMVVPFEVPGLKVPGSQAPGIQSCTIVPHAQAAILMVSGGDRATWPRDGNRPIYFWMDLKAGKTVRFPTGWDLNRFSANEEIAVFSIPPEKQTNRRPFRAIAMRTGTQAASLPDLRKENHVPFDWTDKQRVKPLYERRRGQGDADYFAGLSVGGLVLPVDLGLKEVRYLSQAKAGDGFAGFRLRRSGASMWEPSALWIVPFKDTRKAEVIATRVTDFAMLGEGNVVYVTAGQERKASSENRDHAEAFFHGHADRSSWNVLAGVERLPKLDKKLNDAPYIMDRTKVRLIEGFGASRPNSLVMCLYDHHRGDFRALTIGQERLLKSVHWRRALLVTHDGRRYLAPVLPEGNLPDQFWLHNSGRLLMGTYAWEDGPGDRRRQVQLSECMLEFLGQPPWGNVPPRPLRHYDNTLSGRSLMPLAGKESCIAVLMPHW